MPVRPITPGTRFGRLIVLSPGEFIKVISGKLHPTSICLCDCGKTIVIRSANLRRDRGTKSCGCLARETSSIGNTTHGHSRTGRHSGTYNSWCAMKGRCDNPNHNYHKRGRTYCERWKRFEHFIEDMGERPEGLEIERVNNKLGYFKENCIWDTPANQNRNKDDSVKITIDGVTKNQSVWCRENGVSATTYSRRVQSGWDIKRALFTPPEKQHKWITFNGETLHLSAWARKLGLTVSSLFGRLKRNSVEKALTMPVRGRTKASDAV